jgi:alkylation response protein AidB-like acyl-CoA dehydrogenase
MIARMGTKEQCQRWLVPIATDTTGTQLICFGATEPSGGSEIFCPHADPRLGTRTRARRDGDHYVINGTKVFSSNAGVSGLCSLLARNDDSRANLESCSVFFSARTRRASPSAPSRTRWGIVPRSMVS